MSLHAWKIVLYFIKINIQIFEKNNQKIISSTYTTSKFCMNESVGFTTWFLSCSKFEAFTCREVLRLRVSFENLQIKKNC